ncbi:MAG: polysaccharide deacetylase family protein [Clostridia bacterium]|nr:polysaccharide deacetylase family protein [Clostridia bacterium]
MKRLLALIMSLALLLSAIPSMSAEDEIMYTGTVAGGSLHLRKEPSSSGKVINTYKAGTKVDILENDGVWCKVKVGKSTGYMMTQYLKIEPNYPHLGWSRTPDDGTVLNLRAAADGASRVVYKALSGCVLETVEDAGSWMRVRAGSVFGYVEKSRLTSLSGDYTPAPTVREEGLTALSLRTAPREVGSARGMERTEGDFTYSVNYPALDFPAADSAMSGWVQDMIRLFEADHQANHGGEPGHLTVEYQAVKVDDRYQSVLLMALYEVGFFQVNAVKAVNVDTQSGRVLSGEKDLFTLDTSRPMFCLESAVARLLHGPADGYDGKPDMGWLRWAVLTREGVQVYLPAGLFLPPSLGTCRVDLRYQQVGECMGLDSEWIASHLRIIDPTKPMIALTFDDGPSEETDRILQVLAEYNARATFCVIGSKVEEYSGVIKRIIAGGNEIACHTWSHPKLINLSASNVRSQIERTNSAVSAIVPGYQVKVLRPPYGSVNKTVRTVCAELDMVIAHWQVDTLDWSTRNAKKTYRAIMKGASNGVIILCHDLYGTTADAAEQAIPELINKGYQLVTVSELLSFHKDGAVPGTVYNRVDPENIVTGK